MDEYNDNKPDKLDIEYWTRHTVPYLSSLISTAGYSSAEQEAQLSILIQHVIPYLGPRPSKANTTSFASLGNGSPFQPQINISSQKPFVRYIWEPLGPHGASDRDPWAIKVGHEAISHISKVFGFSTQWIDKVISAYTPEPEDCQKLNTALSRWFRERFNLPAAPFKRIPFTFVAFDLKGSSAAVKVYINPAIMEISKGISGTKIALDTLRTLKPSFKSTALDAIDEFLQGRTGIEMTAFDCVDEANLSKARAKLYLTSPSNSFNTVRDYVTLGGRINNQVTTKYLGILRDIWNLLLQDPEGIHDDDYETPGGDSQKTYYSLELKPGMALPEVKVYVPTWKYVRSDKETVQNYQRIFQKCGHDWGKEGVYRAIYEDAFGPVDVKHPTPVHSDSSFVYNEKQGIYQTIYYSVPLEEEN